MTTDLFVCTKTKYSFTNTTQSPQICCALLLFIIMLKIRTYKAIILAFCAGVERGLCTLWKEIKMFGNKALRKILERIR